MSLLLFWPVSVQGTAPSFPTVYLEVAFTTNPTAPPVWERIPLADIRSIDINRGRSRELDQFQAGRMTCVLDNRDRLYDPLYTAGTHFGNILPNRRIRLIAVWDTTYYLFSGYVDSWTQNWDMTDEATVTIAATDGFKVLARADLASSAYVEEVQADGPIHWWRLGDAVGSTVVSDDIGSMDLDVVYGTPATGVILGTAGLVVNDSNTAATLDDQIGMTGFQAQPAESVPGGPFTVEILYKGTATSGALIVNLDSSTNVGYLMDISAGNVRFNLSANGVNTGTTTSTVAVNDGTTHHIAGVWDADGALHIYVDGIDVTDFSDVITLGTWTVDLLTLGVGGYSVLNTATGIIDESAIYDYALSAARVAAHADAALTAWDGDTSGERIGRLLDVIKWPDADRDVDTGDSTLDSANLNTSALAHAQLVTDSEYGELWITGDGKVRFLSRSNRWENYTAVEAVFSDDGADTGYTQLAADYSDQQIRNRVTIARAAGISLTANSTSSQDQFFIQSYSKTGLINDDDVESRDHANYVMNRYDQPLFRFDQLTVRPQKTPATWFPVVLGLELVDRVNVERTPQSVGTAIDDNFVVEGISHTIRPKLWETVFYVSPADTPGAFILDSTSQGILDTNVLGW